MENIYDLKLQENKYHISETINIDSCIKDHQENIYVLKLQENKYYIGETTNIYSCIKDHKENKGSLWTKKYKMIECIEIIKSEDPFDKDKIVKKYMMKYGIDNVRGGTYSKLNISKIEKNILRREIFTAMKRCYKCGKKTHYVNNCIII
jgi:predicted GIY-YIG superfamily endonuclease